MNHVNAWKIAGLSYCTSGLPARNAFPVWEGQVQFLQFPLLAQARRVGGSIYAVSVTQLRPEELARFTARFLEQQLR